MSLVLSCGRKGLDWVCKQPEITIGFDKDSKLVGLSRFICGDVLDTRLGSGTVRTIYADFLLNAIMPPGANFQEVISQPSILEQAPWPSLVRDWYRRDFRPLGEPIDGHLEEIRWLLRRAALQEMWRILKKNGRIIIVDKAEIIDWVLENALDFLPTDSVGIDIGILPITQEDFQRFDESPQGAKKAVIRKISY